MVILPSLPASSYGMVLRANPGGLRVVQVAEHVAKGCASLAQTFRGPGALARADQLVRASTSICLNIVEGCGRGSVPDFRRFLLQARGSAQETLALLRMVVPNDEEQQSAVRSLQSSTVLILKMLTRSLPTSPTGQVTSSLRRLSDVFVLTPLSTSFN